MYFVSATGFGLFGAAAIAAVGNEDRGVNGAVTFLSGVTLGVSAGYLYLAIARIGFISTDEERHRRWQASTTRNELMIARFESELEAEAKLARTARFMSAGSSLGVAAVGGVTLAVAATQRLTDGGRTGLNVFGGAMLAVGLWGVVSDLVFESAVERAHRLYRAGQGPEPSQRKPKVTPEIAPYGAGLAVSARF